MTLLLNIYTCNTCTIYVTSKLNMNVHVQTHGRGFILRTLLDREHQPPQVLEDREQDILVHSAGFTTLRLPGYRLTLQMISMSDIFLGSVECPSSVFLRPFTTAGQYIPVTWVLIEMAAGTYTCRVL